MPYTRCLRTLKGIDQANIDMGGNGTNLVFSYENVTFSKDSVHNSYNKDLS